MTTPEMETSQQAIALLSEALKGLPVLAVMWHMLRDVRATVKEIATKVSSLELNITENTVRIDTIKNELSNVWATINKAKGN